MLASTACEPTQTDEQVNPVLASSSLLASCPNLCDSQYKDSLEIWSGEDYDTVRYLSMATLKDVAKLAEVSEATASLALNNGPVRESTRKRVLACARRLRYVPNRIGRILTTGRSNAVALLIMTSSKHADTVHKTSLFYYLVEGILSVLDRAGFTLRFDVKCHEDPNLRTYFEHMVGDRSLDGIIIVPQFVQDYHFINLLQERAFPYIMLRPAHYRNSVNYVDMGNLQGGKIVAALLKSLGCEKIALINGPDTHLDAIERERGFTDGIASAGLSRFEKRYGDFTIPSGFQAMEKILSKFIPEAIFCANDYMAAGAIKYLHERKIDVPRDIAVVGYDNNDISVGLFPSLTTVDNRFEDLGEALAKGLLALIDGTRASVQCLVRPVLIKRQSHLWTPRKSVGRLMEKVNNRRN